ncbi:RidA family protein [Microvirga puerhi]|uniref:Rid family detoxifying hydrolase n=1 Tax=Microvirga puerhi TaxID=2876078 RepID=A0ABS7VSJ8_9HYPH|nr:Rid family detoxifying hydrolase [Microvirga puerhi]MBZ6078542.1 Rid family detoxifying hydrolase [Microvirga puerhi]
MTFSSITAPRASPPRGPYSQATRAGNLIFVSGQLPLNSEGSIVGAGDIKVQTRAVLANLAVILEASESSLAKVVKTTVFLACLDDFRDMNEVYAETFAPPYPARSTVEVARFPGGILIEIECIALA